ncbi:MAG: sulfotransferase domain-containing protein [Desulfobulbaceae bacterium]|nr:sulfotransferase domain-containing protein [Desulfobulbaceae bacterium]
MPDLKSMKRRWVKEPVSRLIWQYRQATWSRRSLPDFIIIGAQKSGTTSLNYYLGQHPRLYRSCKKEIHYFDGGRRPVIDNFARGPEWYRAHFPFSGRLGADSRTFEASPLYMFNPLAARRIFDTIPDVRLIAVLRNPTERAISHYFHEKRKGREPLPMLEAMQQEEERLLPVIADKDYKSNTFIRYSYKSRGLYRQQLERFLEYFPRQQMLVLDSKELFVEPYKALEQVFEFIGVDAGFRVKKIRPRNVGKNRTEVTPAVYEYLNEYFLPHNQELYDLLGKDFGWDN